MPTMQFETPILKGIDCREIKVLKKYKVKIIRIGDRIGWLLRLNDNNYGDFIVLGEEAIKDKECINGAIVVLVAQCEDTIKTLERQIK